MIITETSTETLVLQARQNDANAYGCLYERYFFMVLATTTKVMYNTHDAEDLAQDVFIQALSKLNQLKRPASFPGWIRTMAHRMALNFSLRKKPKLRLAANQYIEEACDTKTIEALEAAEQRAILMKGLGRLRLMDRRTLETFYLDELSIRELADFFGAPQGTIKRRLHVARKRLHKELVVEL